MAELAPFVLPTTNELQRIQHRHCRPKTAACRRFQAISTGKCEYSVRSGSYDAETQGAMAAKFLSSTEEVVESSDFTSLGGCRAPDFDFTKVDWAQSAVGCTTESEGDFNFIR